MDLKAQILVLVSQNLNVPGFLNGLIDGVLKNALQKLVDDTTNPFDDVAVAALYPLVSKLVESEVQTLWNSLVLPAPAPVPAPVIAESAPAEVAMEPAVEVPAV